MAYRDFRSGGLGGIPVVIKNLIIINILVFLLSMVAAQVYHFDLTDYLALHAFSSPLFRPYQLVTHMFMHAGFDHILLNMFGLFMFGRMLEVVWGPKRFLTFYMIAGVGAALIYLGYEQFNLHALDSAVDSFVSNPAPDSYMQLMTTKFSSYYNNVEEIHNQVNAFAAEWTNHAGVQEYAQRGIQDVQTLQSLIVNTPMVGASGAIYGVLIAFGMMFPDTMLIMLFFPVPIRAKYAVILYAAIELGSGLWHFAGDNVAHFAHLGGMLFGFIMVKYWQRKHNRF